jgi:hypothetical protein
VRIEAWTVLFLTLKLATLQSAVVHFKAAAMLLHLRALQFKQVRIPAYGLGSFNHADNHPTQALISTPMYLNFEFWDPAGPRIHLPKNNHFRGVRRCLTLVQQIQVYDLTMGVDQTTMWTRSFFS